MAGTSGGAVGGMPSGSLGSGTCSGVGEGIPGNGSGRGVSGGAVGNAGDGFGSGGVGSLRYIARDGTGLSFEAQVVIAGADRYGPGQTLADDIARDGTELSFETVVIAGTERYRPGQTLVLDDGSFALDLPMMGGFRR